MDLVEPDAVMALSTMTSTPAPPPRRGPLVVDVFGDVGFGEDNHRYRAALEGQFQLALEPTHVDSATREGLHYEHQIGVRDEHLLVGVLAQYPQGRRPANFSAGWPR